MLLSYIRSAALLSARRPALLHTATAGGGRHGSTAFASSSRPGGVSSTLRRTFATGAPNEVPSGILGIQQRGKHRWLQFNTRWLAFRLRVRLIKRVVLGSLGLAALGVGTAFFVDEGIKRSLQFNFTIMPLYVHYRWVQWRVSHLPPEMQTPHFERLHNLYQNDPLRLCLKLKGFYVKIGQVISAFGGGAVPEQYVESLRVLQDNVPAESGEYARKLLEESLGCPVEEVFSYFDDHAMAAASIGQVHRARLLDGTDVVVKVMYPSVEKYFKMDIATMVRFTRMAAPEQVPVLREVEKQFMTEFDYQREARQLREASENIMPHFPGVVIPLPIDEQHPSSPRPGGLCTRQVLVMEMLHGKSLMRAMDEQLDRMARAEGKTARELRKEFQRKFEQGEGMAEPPSRTKMRLYRGLIALGDYLRNGTALTYNWTLGWVAPPIDYKWRELPIDAASVIDVLFRVHAHQLFINGAFNADSHPGNIMLLDDGRVGLIDYGQVKRIAHPDRIKFARLLLALAERDQVATVALWKECGFATEGDDHYVIDKWATYFFSRMSADVVDELGGLALFQENLEKIDRQAHNPEDFIMVFRMAALLRANAMSLGFSSIDSSQMWKEQALNILHAHDEPPPSLVPGRQLHPDSSGHLTAKLAAAAADA